MSADRSRRVVIFRDHLLYPSETFIQAQTAALRSFSPVYAGSRRVPGLKLPAEGTHTIYEGDAIGRLLEIRFKLLGKAPQLIERLRALNPLLIHAHFGPDGLRALPLARALGIPMIVTFHGSDATVVDLKYHNAYYGHRQYIRKKRLLQEGAALFLAVSEFIKSKLVEQHFPPDKVIVHYVGVDTTLFTPRGVGKECLVLFVGRFIECKGAEYLIRAMSEVQNEKPDAELVLIGDGPLRQQLEAQAKRSLRRYRFLGVQSAETVRQWMDRASIFAAPSVRMQSGQEEAFGMVFAEAQAMQMPVVTFDTGGIGEAVSHGETGFVAAQGDWQALAKYLALLLRDENLRHRFGVAGRQRVLSRFDLTKQTRRLETIYETVIDAAKEIEQTSLSRTT